MLSVLLMEADDALPHLVRFYSKPRASILDITYGKGTLVRKWDGPVTGIDLKPQPVVGHRVIEGDFSSTEIDGSFDVGLYDPPYLYGRTSEVLYQRSDPDWKSQHTNAFTPADFFELSRVAAVKLWRHCPVALIKVMNSRIKGELVDNREMVREAFTSVNWKLRDELIYVRLGVGVFRNNRTAQVAHGYWLVCVQEVLDKGQ